jgi:hypothetical protein
MSFARQNRNGVGWLELLLVLAVLALVFQVFPSLWFNLLWAMDVRNWSRTAWFAVNVAVLLFLFGVRFVPDLVNNWQERRTRNAADSTIAEKRKALKRRLY